MHKEGLITIMESNYLDKCVLKRDTPDCFFKKTPRRMGETLPGKFRRDERVQGSKPLRGIAWSFLPLKVKRQTSRNLNEEEEEEDFTSKWLLRLKSPSSSLLPSFFLPNFFISIKKKEKKYHRIKETWFRDSNFNKPGRGKCGEVTGAGAKVRFDTENRLGSRPVCENRAAAMDSGEVVGEGRVDERESSWKSNLYNWMDPGLEVQKGQCIDETGNSFRNSSFFLFFSFWMDTVF